MESIYTEYQNRNQNLLKYLEKSYQEQLKVYQELDPLVSEQIQGLFKKEKVEMVSIYQQQMEEFNLLDHQRITFETEETRVSKEIEILESQEEHLNNEIVYQLSLSTEINDQIEVLKEENSGLLRSIQTKQKEKQVILREKQDESKKISAIVLNLKTTQKGENLINQERLDYLQKSKDQIDFDYTLFKDNWKKYQEKVHDREEDIVEMIAILEEELKNKNLKQQLERRKAAALDRRWLEEVKRNKKQIKLWLAENQQNHIRLNILKGQQSNWLINIKREHQISLDEMQRDSQEIETQLFELKNQIKIEEQTIEDLEQKVSKGQDHLVGTIRHHRQNLGASEQKKMILEDSYRQSLISLNRLYHQCQEESESDPFQDEIKKISIRNERNLLSIEKIKKREMISIQQNKIYINGLKSHLNEIRGNIKNYYQEVDKIKKMAANQEIRADEEDLLYQEKYNKHYQKILEQNEHADGLEKNYLEEIQKLKNRLDRNEETYQFSHWDCQTQIDKLRQGSNKLLRKADQLELKRNTLGFTEEKTKKDVQKRKEDLHQEKTKLGNLLIMWQKDLDSYQTKLTDLEEDRQDFQIETLQKVQELFKIKNTAEKELRLLQGELELTQHDLKKTFDERIDLQRRINLEIRKLNFD